MPLVRSGGPEGPHPPCGDGGSRSGEATAAKRHVLLRLLLAAEIVRDRKENGPYETAEALMRVRGIGERVVENNRENIRVKESDDRDD